MKVIGQHSGSLLTSADSRFVGVYVDGVLKTPLATATTTARFPTTYEARKCSEVTGEADVDQTWLGVAAGTIVLVIAVVGVSAHYLRERRRADLLRNLDHHEWWQQNRSRR